MSVITTISLDADTIKILKNQPRSFNLSEFVRNKLKELDNGLPKTQIS